MMFSFGMIHNSRLVSSNVNFVPDKQIPHKINPIYSNAGKMSSKARPRFIVWMSGFMVNHDDPSFGQKYIHLFAVGRVAIEDISLILDRFLMLNNHSPETFEQNLVKLKSALSHFYATFYARTWIYENWCSQTTHNDKLARCEARRLSSTRADVS